MVPRITTAVCRELKKKKDDYVITSHKVDFFLTAMYSPTEKIATGQHGHQTCVHRPRLCCVESPGIGDTHAWPGVNRGTII